MKHNKVTTTMLKLSLLIIPLVSSMDAAALSSSSQGFHRFTKHADWITQEIAKGRPVSDRLMKFYSRVTEASRPEQASQEQFDFCQLERQLNNAECDLKAHLKGLNKNIATGHPICISQKDVGTTGLIISKPGYYRLKENIVFDPSADFIPAISIQSDNVILDLNGKTLSESSAGFASFDNTTGIIVQSGFNFVTIKNGKVTGFSDNGIWVASTNSVATDHEGIVISHLQATNCGKPTTYQQVRVFNSRSGIAVDGATDVIIQDCCASNIISQIETDVISSYFVENILIKDSHASNGATTLQPGGDANGVIVGFFSNVVIEGCTGTEISSYFPIGVIVYVGDTAIIRNCKGHHNSGTLITAGISPEVCTNVLVIDCEANDNSTANTDPTQPYANVRGIYNGPLNAGVIVKNLETKRNSLTASAIPTLVPEIFASGNFIDSGTNILTINCQSEENFVSPGVAAYSVSGFGVGGLCSNIIYKKCNSRDHTTDLNYAIAAGFFVGLLSPSDLSGITLECCLASNSSNSINPANGFGILLGNPLGAPSVTVTNSSLLNNTAKCNNIGIGVAGVGTTNNLVQHNKALNNSFFGILDTSCDSNTYIANYSCNPHATGICGSLSCGSGPLAGDHNFCGLPSGTPPQKSGRKC